MTLVLSLRIDGDASGLQASAKASREDVDRLRDAIDAAGAAGARAGDGLERAGQGAGQAGGAAGGAAPNVERLAREFDDIKRSVDPAHEALRRYEQQQRTVSQAVAAGAATQQEAAQVMAQAARRYQAAVRGSVAGFRSAGAAAQQFGYQVGDLAVQVASGQNAIIALTQQGTQLLQAFGPWGSVIGAAAAIVGVAAVSLLEFEDAADKAEKAQTALRDSLAATKDVIGDSADDILNLADRYKVATEAQKRLIDAEIATRIADNTAKIREQITALKELAFDDVSFDAPIDDTGLVEAGVSIADLADTFEITRDGARRLAQALTDFDADPTKESAERLTLVLAELNATSTGDREALNELTTAVVEIARTLENATTETDRLRQAQALLSGETITLDKTQRDRARELQREREEGRRLSKQRVERIDELKLELRQVEALVAAHGEDREAVERANVENETAVELAKLKVKADSDQGRAIADLIAKIHEKRKAEAAAETLAALQRELKVQQGLTEAQRQGGRAIADASDAQKAYAEIVKLGLAVKSDEAEAITKVITAIEEEGRARQQLIEIRNLEDEIQYLEDLAEAHRLGKDAVAAVNAENRVRLTLAKLNLDADSEQGKRIADLIRQLERQKVATARVEEAANAYREVWSNAIEDVQKSLTDSIEKALEGNLDSVGDWAQELLSIVRRTAAALISQQFVIPFVTAGADLIGLGSAVPDSYRAASGQSGGFNPISSIGNHVAGKALDSVGFNPFSSLSSGVSNLGYNLSTGGVSGALLGQAGGQAASIGVAAVPGGVSNAATTGLLGAGGQITAAGALGAIGVVAAIAGLLYATGVIGPNPSVGPVGIADFSPGLGRGKAFDVDGIDPFTSDNGGDGEALRPIAEAIADLIADSADRFSATINDSLRFRVAKYDSPEGGSGRTAGYEVNAFINQEAEKRVAEGLSQEDAIFEALKFAVTEAFDFESQALDDAVQNITADTTDELLSQLQTVLDFDDVVTALRDNSLAITASTLTQQEMLLSLRRRGEETGRSAVEATRERFELLADLFAAPEELAGLGRNGTPAPTANTARLDALRASPPDWDRGALRGGDGIVDYDQDSRTITAGDRAYTLRSTGDDVAGLELQDAAGEVIGTFRTLSEALIGAAEAAETATDAVTQVDDATRDLYDRNLSRVRDAIQVTRAEVDRDLGRLTGTFEEPQIEAHQARYIEGSAAIEAYGDQLETINDAFRQQAEDFPELADELNDFLIDVPATISQALSDLRDQVAQDFRDDLDAEDRQLRGAGAVDTVRDLIDTRDQRVTAANELGVDPALVNRNFRVAVEKSFQGLDIDVIREIKDNITDPVVQALADAEISKRVTAFNQSIDDQLLALESPLAAELVGLNRRFQADLEFANDNGGDTSAVMRLYQEQAKRLVEGTDDVETALNNTVSAFTRLLPDLKQFRYELQTDPTLATETTVERYDLIKARFDEIADAAVAGDVDAQAQLEEAGRELLEVSRLVNAANDNYAADRRVVLQAVDAAIGKAETELQVAKDQLSALNGIDARLADMAQALANGQFGKQPTSNLILAQASGYTGSFGDGGFQEAARAYVDARGVVLGAQPDLNAQLAYVTGYTGAFGSGGFQDYVRTSAVSELQREAARIVLRANGKTPGFIDGGFTGGGLVTNGDPDRDSVFRVARDEFVIRRQAVAQLGVPTLSYMNATGRLPGTEGGVVAELRAIADELRQQGEASRLQSRDDADLVADQVGLLRRDLAPLAAGAAHERARPGRAA